MHVKGIIRRVWFLNQKEKWMFKKKKTQESEGQEKWVQEERDQENKRRDAKRMKNLSRKRLSFSKYRKSKERLKKKRNCSIFFEKGKKKKILPERTKLRFVRM